MRKYAHKYTVRQLFVSNFEFLMLRGVPKVHLIRRCRLCRAGSLFSSAGRCNKNNTWTKQSYEHFKAGGSKRRHDVFLINFPLLTYKTTSEILQMSFRGVCNVYFFPPSPSNFESSLYMDRTHVFLWSKRHICCPFRQKLNTREIEKFASQFGKVTPSPFPFKDSMKYFTRQRCFSILKPQKMFVSHLYKTLIVRSISQPAHLQE